MDKLLSDADIFGVEAGTNLLSDEDVFGAPEPATKPEPRAFGSVARGWNRLQQAGAAVAGDLGLISPETAAASIATDEADIARYPMPAETQDALRRIHDADGWGASIWETLKNPSVIASVMGESIPMSIPGMVLGAPGALAGPVGASVGIGAGSGITEYAASMMDYMQDNGVDPSDANAVAAALSNPEFMAGARAYAAKRGVAVGTFDALTAGISGRVGSAILRGGRTARRAAAAAAATTGIEAAGGAGGEAAAQLATEGKINPGEVVLEGVAEIVPGVGEATISAPREGGDRVATPSKARYSTGDTVLFNDGPIDGVPGDPRNGQRATISGVRVDRAGNTRYELTFEDGSQAQVTDMHLLPAPAAEPPSTIDPPATPTEPVAPEAAAASGDAREGDGAVERPVPGAPVSPGGDVAVGSPPDAASPPEPAPAPSTVAAKDRATLRRSQLADDDIDAMSPEEIAREVERVRQAGVSPSPEEVMAAGAYSASGRPAEAISDASAVPQRPTAESLPEPSVGRGGAMPMEGLSRPALSGDGSRGAPIQAETPEAIDIAGQRVNTEPSDAQKEAGNYQKAHLKLAGLDITIENPKGSTRTGKGADGHEWSVEMPAAYGYIKRTTGSDGDHVDVYVGDDPQSRKVYVVDQVSPVVSGKAAFDEHKVVLGVNSAREARALYASAFSDGRGNQRVGAITPMSMAQFRRWLAEGDTRKPVRYGVERLTDEGYPADAQGKTRRPPSLIEFLAGRGGIADPDGDLRAMDAQRAFVPGVGRLMSRKGVEPDEARRAAVEAGYLQDADYDQVTTSTVADLYEAIRRDLAARDVFAWQDRDWAEAWRSERGRDEDARREDEARERVMAEMQKLGYTGSADDAYAQRVIEIAISRDMATDDAMERAAFEMNADDDVKATVDGEEIPFDLDPKDRSDAVQPRAAPEDGPRLRAAGERGEGQRPPVEAEGRRSAPSVRGEGRPDQRGDESDDRSAGEGPEERRPRVDRRTEGEDGDGLRASLLSTVGRVRVHHPDVFQGRLFEVGRKLAFDNRIRAPEASRGEFPDPEIGTNASELSKLSAVMADFIEDRPSTVLAMARVAVEHFGHVADVAQFGRDVRLEIDAPEVIDADAKDEWRAYLRRHARESGETLYSIAEEPGAEGKPQTVLPGAERISDKELAERRGAQPLRAKVAQKDPGGLFSDEKDQQDLFQPVDIPPLSIADLEEARKWVRREARAQLAGKEVTTRNGDKVLIPWKGIKHATDQFSRDSLAAMMRMDAIIEASVWENAEADRGSRPDILRVHRYRASARIGEKPVFVLVFVREHADGRRFYDQAVIDEKGSPGTSGAEPSSPTHQQLRPSGEPDRNVGQPALHGNVERELREIVQRVSGLSDTEFVQRIHVAGGMPAWGVEGPAEATGVYSPARDAITLALTHANRRTAYHEAFHRLQLLFLSDQERGLLTAEQDRLKQIIAAAGTRSDRLLRMDPFEVEAEAFAIWSDQMDRNNAAGVRLHIGLRRAWQRIRTVISRVSNWLDGHGFRTLEDVFGEAREGRIAQRPKRERIARQSMYSIAERFPDVPARDLPKAMLTRRLSATLRTGVRMAKNLGPLDRRTRDDGESAGDYLHRKLVDYLHPLRRMQEHVETPLNDLNDAYLNARLAEDTALAAIQTMHDKYVRPMVDALAGAGVQLEDLHRYLYALHAEERNRVVGLRNEEGSDLHRAVNDPSVKGASGMSTNEARGILAEARRDPVKFAALRKAAADVRAMLDQSLRDQRAAGLIDTDTFRLLTEQWSDYVPLKGQDGQDEMGGWRPLSAGGFDVRGDEFKGAMGRFSEADNVIANAVAQAEQSILRQKKNDVGKAVLRFVNEFDPKGERIAQVYWSGEEGFGDITKVKEVHRRVLGEDGKVTTRKVPNPFRTLDDVLATKVGGRTYFIRFADPKVGHALRKLGMAQIDGLSRLVRHVSIWQSIVNTRANPAFTPINIIRDVQTGAIHLLDEGFKASEIVGVVANIPRAWGALWRQSRGKAGEGEWDRLAKEYFDNGGKITFQGYSTMEETLAKLQKDIARGISGEARPKAMGKAIWRFVEHLNDAGENGIRLAAYAAARRGHGKTARQAAFLARDLTVDFKKRGELGPLMNSWYVFFNAALQGNYNIARRMARSRKVQAAVGTFIFAGMMQSVWNSLMAGDDDDGENAYLKLLRDEPYKLERQFVFFLPGSTDYVSFPMPYGYNAFHHLGVQGAAIMAGQKDAVEGILDAVRVAFDAFNPIGSGDIWSMIIPTVGDPIAEIERNLSFSGAPIYPSGNPFDPAPAPDSQTAWRSTSGVAKWIAEQINEMTGGNEVEPGAWDVHPDTLEHLWGFFAGGLGRFASQTAETAERTVRGEIEPKKTPWVRSFYGAIDKDSQRGEYFRQRESVLYADGKLKEYIERGDGAEATDFQRRRAIDLAAAPAFKAAEKQRRAINKRRRAIEGDREMSATERRQALDELDAAEIEIMREARRAYAEARRDTR